MPPIWAARAWFLLTLAALSPRPCANPCGRCWTPPNVWAAASASPCWPWAAVWWAATARPSWPGNCRRWTFGCPRQICPAGPPCWRRPCICRRPRRIRPAGGGCFPPGLLTPGSRWEKAAATVAPSAPFRPSAAGSNPCRRNALRPRPVFCWGRACGSWTWWLRI